MVMRSLKAGFARKEGFSVDMYTGDEIRAIHHATLEVLEKTGVKVYLEEALNLFKDAGAKVNRDENLVKIPPWLVEEAVQSAPSAVTLAGREPKYDVVLEGERINFTCGGAAVKIVDPDSGVLRKALLKDVASTAIMADALDEVSLYGTAIVPTDVPADSSGLYSAEIFLSNTAKHCHHIDTSDGAQARKYFELAAAIVGGMDKLQERPLVSMLICPVSTLQLPKESCEKIIECAKAGIPANILTMALAGASSPVTLAAAQVVQNAEVLSGIVLAQLVNKGAPVIYGSSTSSLDMQCATAPIGSPEIAIINAGASRLASFYALPMCAAAGLTDSKLSDAQAGHEKTLCTMLPALAGSNIMYGMGMMDSGLTFSFSEMMIDAEIVRMVQRVVRGVDVNDITLAVDVIKEVGPGKDFLTQSHTLEYMKSEQSRVKVFDRKMRDNWEEEGSKSAAQKAAEMAREIIATHKPEPLEASVKKELRRIVESI